METEKNDNVQTDLHSKKVRKLLGEIPSVIIRWDNLLIVIILLALLAAACLLPYPYSNGESIIEHTLLRVSRLVFG